MYEALLERFALLCRETFGDELTGVYLHGSMAMGCFHPQRSDLDLIVVVEAPPTDAQKRRFLQGVVALDREAPEKGLELSVVERRFCKPFVYPTPYAFHFSKAHLALAKDPAAYLEKLQGVDPDLAAHFTIINRCGRTLCGASAQAVFAPVPARDYAHSIWLDVENAQADIAENPVYVTLNLCRVLAFLREGLVLSKREGGAWGLRRLSTAYCGVIRRAMRAYAGGEIQAEDGALQAFAAEMIALIRREIERAGIVPLG